uniref:Uncharacterized protein n=1 Tax=Solanum lycopersicum TaxID=4081 RepID=A0A3Q7EV44_SOLLC
MRNLSNMDSSMCSSVPDREMWIIQGTLPWLTPPVRIGECLLTSFFSHRSYFTKTCLGIEEGGNTHTWKAQYNGELYDALGKEESLPKRNLLILFQLVGPLLARSSIDFSCTVDGVGGSPMVPSSEISGEEYQGSRTGNRILFNKRNSLALRSQIRQSGWILTYFLSLASMVKSIGGHQRRWFTLRRMSSTRDCIYSKVNGEVQTGKGLRWIPRNPEMRKGAVIDKSLRGVENKHRYGDSRIGQPLELQLDPWSGKR